MIKREVLGSAPLSLTLAASPPFVGHGRGPLVATASIWNGVLPSGFREGTLEDNGSYIAPVREQTECYTIHKTNAYVRG